jgi:hypothetical protein
MMFLYTETRKFCQDQNAKIQGSRVSSRALEALSELCIKGDDSGHTFLPN